ncbi:hypothetical protein [Cellulomonas alba]|uniref:Uncharacterized protein n=1 Tax=Cellulomonas alba TaxID=3053467 RepID=A0ABT7SKA4_9CELL|nr:hypothetical protein [Cellulomonas alba]MDM7856626.1 hypothetical protein [Cellulomonas alba]
MTDDPGQTVRDIARSTAKALADSGVFRPGHPQQQPDPYPGWLHLALGKMLLLTKLDAPAYVSGSVAATPTGQPLQVRLVMYTADLVVIAEVESNGYTGGNGSSVVRALPRRLLTGIEVGDGWFDPFEDEPDETHPRFTVTYADGTVLTLPSSPQPSNAEWSSLRALRATLLDDLART